MAQALNFVAMLLPVAFGRLEDVALLVVSAAIASIVAYTASFAFPSLYPGIREDRERSRAFSVALLGVFIASASLEAAGIVALLLMENWAPTLFLAGLLSLSQAAYLIAITVLIREGNHRRFASTRTVYAITNVSLTCAVVFLVEWPFALTMVAATSMATGATFAARGRIRAAWHVVRISLEDRKGLVAYTLANWPAAASNLGGSVAYQVSSLATGFLGSYANVWAGVVRVSGGFAGLSQNVVAPMLEMRFSSEVRAGNQNGAREATLRAIWAGAIVAVFAYVVLLGTLFFGPATQNGDQFDGFLLISGAYALGALLPVVAGKFLVMLGHQRSYLIWAYSKLFVAALSLLKFHGFQLLVALAMLELVSAIAYCGILLVQHSRRLKISSPTLMRSTEAEEEDVEA